MSVAFRVDASDVIGNGHVMRCVALADILAARRARCCFICRDLTAPALKAILDGGHSLSMLPQADGHNDRPLAHADWLKSSWQQDAFETRRILSMQATSWLIVDHYAIDEHWEGCVRSEGLQIAVLDDLADRKHDCDLLVDQNLHDEPYERYDGLLAESVQKLFGPRYALLRKEFSTGAPADLDGENVLVAFSGADRFHLAAMTLRSLDRRRDVTVVVNNQNADIEAIRQICISSQWALHVDAINVAGLMQQASVAIGAGGGMVWERAAFGLPSIGIISADNQRQQLLNARAAGMLVCLNGSTVTPIELRDEIELLANNIDLRKAMSDVCRSIVDGKGCLRVANRLLSSDVTLYLAKESDSDDIWEWRNDPRIRHMAGDHKPIGRDVHQKWFSSVLLNPLRHLLLGSDAQGPLGVVRFDRDESGAEISIYLVPKRLGQGHGAALLLASEAWLANIMRQPLTVRAEVLKKNAASKELFQSCGYVFVDGRFRKKIGKMK